jgi:Flp pilus assembly protein TadG
MDKINHSSRKLRRVADGRCGNAIIEFSLLMPWLIFLFVGALDWGFYMYSLISTQAASRVGAVYASSSPGAMADKAGICLYALEQLRRMPNVGSGASSCVTGSGVSSSAPVGSSVTSVTGVDGKPAVQVSVTYQTPLYIPLMTYLRSQVVITRTMQMRMLQ